MAGIQQLTQNTVDIDNFDDLYSSYEIGAVTSYNTPDFNKLQSEKTAAAFTSRSLGFNYGL